jgi:hypothetical protein
VFELKVLEEELGNFSLFEDEYLDDGSEVGEPCEDDLIGDVDDDGIVDAHQEDLRGRLLLLILTFLHIQIINIA